MSNALWMILLFVGIAVGGTTLAVERIFDLGRTPLLDGLVVASIALVLISFIPFISKLRD